ncbi:MAG: hypothetical protein E4H13_10295 [Calditrichales bacterium]|nr:MAG: hypothetical protein E4H13_10295 [Calditrichales bacterium]
MKTHSSLPNVLWVSIFSLAVFSIYHFIIALSQPAQFIALAVNLILIFGLLRLAKWAFFLSIIASLLGPLVLYFEGTIYFYAVLLLNLTVLVPVLICTKSFFSKITSQPIVT